VIATREVALLELITRGVDSTERTTMPADGTALPLLERRLADLLGVSDDEDDSEYAAEILSSLLDMGDSPDDVAEYLGGFVVDGGVGCEEHDDEVRRFSLDVAKFKAGGEVVPPSPARDQGGGIDEGTTTTTTTTAALSFATMATAIAAIEGGGKPRSIIPDEGGAAHRRREVTERGVIEAGDGRRRREEGRDHHPSRRITGREEDEERRRRRDAAMATEDGRVQESRRDETTTARIFVSPTTTGDGFEDALSSHEEALSTLRSIFSDRGYTARHLDAVLRRWGGNIEDAVEALLLHGDEECTPPDEQPPGELPRMRSAAINRGVGGNGNGKNGIDAKELARHLFVDGQGRHGASSSSSSSSNADDDDDDPSAMTSARDDGGGARADGRECRRSCVPIGANVYVVKKKDQRTGRETRGVVSRHLTNSEYHPRGIKVMLADGTVGRVIKFAR
jgi:uncharacterized repeat protein (TIGR03833 family)